MKLVNFILKVKIVNFTGKDLKHIEIYYNKRRHSFSTTELRKRVVELKKDK